MSSDLSKTAAISADAGFRSRVLAAIVEHGSSAVLATGSDFVSDALNKSLARAVLWDPTQYQGVVAALIADDPDISAAASPGDVTDDQIRSVITKVWTNLAVVVPNPR